MPKLNSLRVKHRMAASRLTAEDLSGLTGLKLRVLRNAIAGRDFMSLLRIYQIAQFMCRRDEPVEDVVDHILAHNEGVPEEPPKQPQRDKGPSRRQESEKTKTSPKRTAARAS